MRPAGLGTRLLCGALLCTACGDDSTAAGGDATGTATGGATSTGVDAGTGDSGAIDSGTIDSGTSGGTGSESGLPEDPPTVFGGDRPVELFVPDGYDPGTPTPLLLLLHAYDGDGASQSQYFGLRSAANARGMLYAYPDGTVDSDGSAFWNATDACCDRYDTGVDDSAYLRGVIEEIEAAYNVHPGRIYLVGHSNGAFMGYRMACDHADKIAAIAGLAGATFKDAGQCQPTEPVNVLHIHGTDDDTVAYDGFFIWGVPFPGAVETTDDWASVGGCQSSQTDVGALDLDAGLAGNETSVTRHEGCDPGGSVELWTIEAGAHSPVLSPDFTPLMLQFLLDHPKP